MFESRTEIFGWVLAILVVVAMGIITFTGPYHKINKVEAKAAAPAVTVKILTDPNTIGRYSPPTITLKPGQSVRFVNDSNTTHTVTTPNWNSGDITNGGNTYVHTFTSAGTFHYYCIYHPLMKGTVVVRA